ncbi:hypothetical protein [Pedobacter sp. Leaf41]|jgi:hypothetical protein|uniref:hypothetical protein n=1 Tax=Pedobacter sp. Leaf41 TaxID=1736218 RepID=UPI0009E7ABC4|nr:hypothetical protein [Pedobacter sp. Leaf41]RZL66857.1 MAG: hypothetical protein EOO93_04775 [Pedobacter sp.]
MKKGLISIFILCTCITFNILAQTSADYNYSIAARGFSLMQLPKILNQTNTQDYTKMYGNGVILKFNDNQISYRISGNYFRNNDVRFQNTCETCEMASGKVTDYSFKIGFEKNFNYSRVQPYFAFDIGYRSNKFTGVIAPQNALVGSTNQSADASKNGLVMSPTLGFKINIIPNLSIFAESSLDFNYSYEKQDITQPNLTARTVNTYNKWEFLLNPVSAGIQFNFNSKN